MKTPQTTLPPRLIVHVWRLLGMLVVIVGVSVLSPGVAILLGIISLLVVLHEGGHLIASKLVGMHSSEFYCGFGPELVSMRIGEVRYGLKALPFGGFVSISGMSNSGPVTDYAGVEVPEARLYRSASTWRKLVAVAAGPVANLVVAVIIVFVALAGVGQTQADGSVARLSIPAATQAAPSLSYDLTRLTVQGLANALSSPQRYISGAINPETVATEDRLVSVVGLSRLSGQAAQSSMLDLLFLVATISVALGVMNLIPIAPLDGGHLVVALLESIVRKIKNNVFTVPTRLLNLSVYFSLTFFISLAVLAVIADGRSPLPNPYQ